MEEPKTITIYCESCQENYEKARRLEAALSAVKEALNKIKEYSSSFNTDPLGMGIIDPNFKEATKALAKIKQIRGDEKCPEK